MQRVLTITDSEPPWLAPNQTIAQDARGRYHGTNFRISPGVMTVIGSDGRRLGSYGSGLGEGPREGRVIAAPFFGPGDTAFVTDARMLRVNVWSPDFKFARSFKVPGAIQDAVIIDANTMIVAANFATKEQSGWPLHALRTDDGTVIRSFGIDVPAFRPDLAYLLRRHLAPAHGAGARFWAAHSTDYIIELWDVNGTKHMEMRRSVDWYPPYEASRGRASSTRPTYTVGIWQDNAGFIWVAFSVPDREYAKNRGGLPTYAGQKVPDPANRAKIVDTIIEVIDPRSARLMASRRFDDDLIRWGQGPLLVYREDTVGNPSYTVYKPVINGVNARTNQRQHEEDTP